MQLVSAATVSENVLIVPLYVLPVHSKRSNTQPEAFAAAAENVTALSAGTAQVVPVQLAAVERTLAVYDSGGMGA
jgi:hypothetical protein